MKNLNILKKLIREELSKTLFEGRNAMENYMFFQNLQTINRATSEMLKMDPQYVDAILSDGHQWAVDHIATSADDVSEVHGFLMNRQPMMESDEDLFSPLAPDQNSNVILKKIVQHAEELLKWNLGLNTAKLNQIESTLRAMVADMDRASDEANSVDEKKLTKAELRKREEVAKGIKKSDPKMPMDKKMAIATAVAKKVAEAKKGFTSKYDDAPQLKGKQKNLPDALQAKIVKSK